MKKLSYDKYFIKKNSINYDPGNKIFKNCLKKDLN